MKLLSKFIISVGILNCILGPIDAYLAYTTLPIGWSMIAFCIAATIFSIWSIGWTYKKSTLEDVDVV